MEPAPVTPEPDPDPAAHRLERENAALRAENARLRARLQAIGAAGVESTHGATLDPVEITVPAGPHAPAAARDAVTTWLSGRVSEAVLADARLVVSELVSNSLRHADLAADAPVRVSASLSDGALRLEVRDPGLDGDIAAGRPDHLHGGGFGLHLVGLIAARWGVKRTGGTHVWVELTV